MRILNLFVLFLAATIAGCDLYPQDDYEEFVVVEAYLVTDRALPLIFVSTTAPVTEEYSFENTGIPTADVRIHLMTGDENSAIEQTFTYEIGMDNVNQRINGVFAAVDAHDVLPMRTYQIDIRIDGREQITGFTTTPNRFQSTGVVPDNVVYQSEEQIEVGIPRSTGDRQNFFIFTTISLEPSEEQLTPIYADFFDPDEDELDEFIKTSSGIVNEGNFELNPDGTITLVYPWIAVAFYGENQIVTNIIDDNLFDFVRSESVQLGGSTLSPGEIPNLIYRLDNAIGVFGSIAADTIQTNVLRPEGF
ncbi:MAG: DUF4249 family protein [Bacteroidota bacterium]